MAKLRDIFPVTMYTAIKRIYWTLQFRHMKAWLAHLRKKPADLSFLPSWIQSNCRERTPLQDQMPWLTYGALRWLRNNVRKDMTTFEYGSGGSTLYFARKVRQHYAVEHDQGWYQIVQKALGEKSAGNVHLTLKAPSHISDPNYGTTKKNLRGSSFREYASFIDRFPDRSFDIILIDGRSRNACIRHAIRKVQASGHIILDNSERAEYADGISVLTNFERKDFFGVGPYKRSFWQTSVFTLDARIQ
jgi:hypothetical protein